MSTWLATLFHQGGPTMFSIEYVGVAGIIVAALHVYAPRRWSLWTGAAIVACVLAIGIYGTLENRRRTDDNVERDEREEREAREHPDPERRPPRPEDIEFERAEGYREAMRPIQFAGVVAGALALVLALGELRRRLSRR
jgi:hypothetical protein